MTDAMPRLATVDRTEQVLDALASFIRSTGIEPGQRLPTERELSESLGVGRSTIREAIRQWSVLGLVDVRKGSGTYLKRALGTRAMPVALLIETERTGLLHTIEVRRGVETEAGALAAVRATPEEIEGLRARLEVMEAAFNRHGAAGPEDLAFHTAIYDACGNPLFGQILAGMRGAFENMFMQTKPDFASRSFPFHRELFDAIARRDPQGAREKTLAILQIVEEDVIRMF